MQPRVQSEKLRQSVPLLELPTFKFIQSHHSGLKSNISSLPYVPFNQLDHVQQRSFGNNIDHQIFGIYDFPDFPSQLIVGHA